MKRDFLKNLGIEDKSIIDAILDENSADIGRAKGELQTYKDKVAELEGTVTTKDGEIATLQKKVGDTEALNNQIAQLTTEKNNLTTEMNTKVTQIKKDHAVEGRILARKGKNVKAIKALLDQDKITFENDELGGIDEQLDALVAAEDSSMLFGESKPSAPSGTQPGSPSNGNGGTPSPKTFADAVAKALNKN